MSLQLRAGRNPSHGGSDNHLVGRLAAWKLELTGLVDNVELSRVLCAVLGFDFKH